MRLHSAGMAQVAVFLSNHSVREDSMLRESCVALVMVLASGVAQCVYGCDFATEDSRVATCACAQVQIFRASALVMMRPSYMYPCHVPNAWVVPCERCRGTNVALNVEQDSIGQSADATCTTGCICSFERVSSDTGPPCVCWGLIHRGAMRLYIKHGSTNAALHIEGTVALRELARRACDALALSDAQFETLKLIGAGRVLVPATQPDTTVVEAGALVCQPSRHHYEIQQH